jgi:hypothetical protein
VSDDAIAAELGWVVLLGLALTSAYGWFKIACWAVALLT